MNSPLIVRVPPGAGRSFRLEGGGPVFVAAGPEGVRVAGGGEAGVRAVFEANADGAWFVRAAGESGGVLADGQAAAEWVHIRDGSRIEIGGVECVVAADVPAAAAAVSTQAAVPAGGPLRENRPPALRTRWTSWLPSLALHLLLLFALAHVVITAIQQRESKFLGEPGQGGFLEKSAREAGGEPAAGGPAGDLAALPPQTTAPPLDIAALTARAPASPSFILPSLMPGPARPDLPALHGGPAGRGGGGGSYRSAGFGTGSGFGRGVGEWISGGSGGLGISGRGKTLKTINEFSVYFVIHSGDWYAALDTRPAPEGRNKEISAPGLPDEKNIRWGTMTPVPGQGPFINYFWGGNWRKPDEDNRRGLVEFTPGAMGNLLRFARQASGGGIKGAAKPAAVVLDRSLVPYTYDKAAKKMTWHPEGREKLRETLRRGLPKFTNFYGGAFGYIWNPQPGDPSHPDFTVEYLLDVRPMPPFIYFTGNDDFTLSEAEVDTLYQYVLRGGAIWGDSGFAGEKSKFDAAFKREMKRVIPDLDKNFKPLKKQDDLFLAGPDAYFDAAGGLARLPYGMQFHDAPIEVIEMMPGLVSVVLTRNAYGNFLRFETAVVNNRFQIGGQIGRGHWASVMWSFREEFFRGLGEGAIVDAYKLGTNILVYMLGRWPAVLSRPENRALLQ